MIPEELDDLLATAMKDIETAKKIGAEEKDLEKVKETQRQSSIKNQKENRYWFGQLSTRYRYGIPIDNIGLEALEAKIAELDAEDIKNAAQKYFDMNNYIKLVLTPEVDERMKE